MLYRVLGFVLKSEDYRESDKLVDIYTDRFGKIKAIVRGAKKITSKLAGKCQPFILLYLTVSPGRSQWYLVGLEIFRVFYNIWQDSIKLKVGGKILLSVDLYTRPEKVDLNFLKLLFSAFVVLDSISPAKAQVVSVCFLIKMVSLLGYRPNFKKCLFCQEEGLDRLKFFHLARGGVICDKCQAKFGGGLVITPETLKTVTQMLDEKLAFWLKVPLPKEKNINEAEKLIERFMVWHLT